MTPKSVVPIADQPGAERPTVPPVPEVYSPPAFAWEQEFVALAGFSDSLHGCPPWSTNPECQ